MINNEVKLDKNGKPVIFEDIDTGEKFVQLGDLMVNVKSESFTKWVGRWSVVLESGQRKILEQNEQHPCYAEIDLY